MTKEWTIQLFGTLRGIRRDQVEVRFRTQKAGSLLGYTAFYLGQEHHRERLSEMLWPDADPASARHSLRMALSLLRRHLEPPGVAPGSVLAADRQTVQLNSDAVTTDVAAFSAALNTAADAHPRAEKISALMAAVDLYRGPLVPGCYESWIVPQQLRLEDEYVGAITDLLRYCEEAGSIQQAVTYARTAVSVHPLREDLHLALMRLHIASGNSAAAVRQYDRHKRLLKHEWGDAPSPTADELRDRARVRHPIRAERTCGAMAADSSDLPASAAAATGTYRGSASSAFVGPAHPPPLPLHPTGFFGRQDEIDSLARWLAPAGTAGSAIKRLASEPFSPLITLTGAAGSGKTRLALETAKRLENVYRQEIWFVPLAEVVEADQILPRIHEAIGLVRLPRVDPAEQAVDFLARRPSLLILDNLEHLLPAASPVLLELLHRVPTLRCLVTSRHTLNLAVEQEMCLGPLPVPELSRVVGALASCPSVQLFVARARLTRPDFEVTRANAQALAELCVQLEGLPLALELAAARIQVMSPAQILGRLAQRFTLLVDRRRDGGARHQSLHTALEWSYQLLPPELRQLFAILSIFRGGWTCAAAMDVCADSSALEGLTELRERSLIVAEDDGIEVRFRMLESVREFAAEKLEPGAQDGALESHARHYARMAEDAAATWWGPDEDVALARLDRVYENMRMALRWLIDDNPKTALRLAGMLARYWYVRGLFDEGRKWLDEALETTLDFASPIRVTALTRAGILARDQADYPYALKQLEEGLFLARSLGDRQGTADALQRLGLVASDRQEFETAHRCLNEALALDGELDNRAGVALSLACLAGAALRQNNLEPAAEFCCKALGEFRALGNKWGTVTSLHLLGSVEYYRGHYAHSAELQQECVFIQRHIGNRRGTALALSALAKATLSLEAIGDKWGAAGALDVTAKLLLQIGNAAHSARMLGAADAVRERLGVPMALSERPEHEALQVAVREILGANAFHLAFSEGSTLPWDQAVLEALRLIEPPHV